MNPSQENEMEMSLDIKVIKMKIYKKKLDHVLMEFFLTAVSFFIYSLLLVFVAQLHQKINYTSLHILLNVIQVYYFCFFLRFFWFVHLSSSSSLRDVTFRQVSQFDADVNEVKLWEITD